MIRRSPAVLLLLCAACSARAATVDAAPPADATSIGNFNCPIPRPSEVELVALVQAGDLALHRGDLCTASDCYAVVISVDRAVADRFGVPSRYCAIPGIDSPDYWPGRPKPPAHPCVGRVSLRPRLPGEPTEADVLAMAREADAALARGDDPAAFDLYERAIDADPRLAVRLEIPEKLRRLNPDHSSGRDVYLRSTVDFRLADAGLTAPCERRLLGLPYGCRDGQIIRMAGPWDTAPLIDLPAFP